MMKLGFSMGIVYAVFASGCIIGSSFAKRPPASMLEECAENKTAVDNFYRSIDKFEECADDTRVHSLGFTEASLECFGELLHKIKHCFSAKNQDLMEITVNSTRAMISARFRIADLSRSLSSSERNCVVEKTQEVALHLLAKNQKEVDILQRYASRDESTPITEVLLATDWHSPQVCRKRFENDQYAMSVFRQCSDRVANMLAALSNDVNRVTPCGLNYTLNIQQGTSKPSSFSFDSNRSPFSFDSKPSPFAFNSSRGTPVSNCVLCVLYLILVCTYTLATR